MPSLFPDAGETAAPDPGEGDEAGTGEAAAIGVGGGSGPGPGALDRPAGLPGAPAARETAPPAEPVARAFAWLARHQLADGSFGAVTSIADCGCPDPGRRDYRVAMTGLATLALLGGGSTHRDGPHARNVRAAIAWLRAEQREGGGFFDRDTPEDEREMYGNAMALLALAEAQRLSPTPLLAVPIDRALGFFTRTQISWSGWRYGPGDAVADTSVTGWAALAIAAAGRAGFVAEPFVRAGILAFLADVTDPATGRVGYQHRGRGSLAMTATGVAVRLALGEGRGAKDLRAARALLAANPPAWADEGPPPDLTFFYFGTLAARGMSGEQERAWNVALRAALLPRQERGGETEGSWPAPGRFDRVGGRILSTALATLCLEEAPR